MKRISMGRVYPVAVMLCVMVAACSQPTAAAPSVAAPTTAPTTSAPDTTVPATAAPSGEVSFMMFGEPAEAAAFQAVADGFEAQNPGAKVTLVPVPGDEEEYHARLASELVGGTPPDVVLIDYDAAAQFYDTGALQSLSSQMAASSVLDPAGLYTPAYEAFQWNGEQMCLPLSISSFVVYYNKALFDAAGQAYPKAGWTWDEFVATAQALTKDTDGDGQTDQFGLGFSPGINNVLPFIWQNGGDLLAEGGKKLALDTPQAREAIQFVVDWQTKYHIVPNRTEATAQSSDERFEAGTLAMRIASRAATPDWRTLSDLDWDVGPLPRRAQEGNILRSDGVCLSGKANNPDLAWKLIEYLVSPDGQTVLALTGQIVPTNISVAQSAAFLDPAARPANSQIWLDNIAAIHIVPPLANWPDIEERANEELESAYYGNTTADTAVEEIMEQSEPFLAP